MSSRLERPSRRELGLVAAALLVPLPLLALTGLSAPLPGAMQRGLGELVTIEAQGEQSGNRAVLHDPENGSDAKKSATAWLSVTRARSVARRVPNTAAASNGAASHSTDHTETGGDTGTNEQGSPDETGGNQSDPSEVPGRPEPSDGASGAGGSQPEPVAPNAQIGVASPGAGALITIDREVPSVDVAAASTDAGNGEAGDVGVAPTRSDGSSTGASVAISGAPIP